MTTPATQSTPLIMGVLNVTPDSFSDGGRFIEVPTAVEQARKLVGEGAAIIDIGGESTRPGADRVSLEVEQGRVIPVIQALKAADWFAASGAKISIDTMNAETAAAAVAAGASIINDVSGGLADRGMFEIAAKTGATLVISHWRGFSDQMDALNQYSDVPSEVAGELADRVNAAIAMGVARDRIVVDPGLGFAKDLEQNWQLVARLAVLEELGLPILLGASRKRFIAGVLDGERPTSVDNSRRDLATAVLTALLLQHELWGVRVHNVQATADAISMVQKLRQAQAEFEAKGGSAARRLASRQSESQS